MGSWSSMLLGQGDSLQENSRQCLSYILPTAARGTP